MSNFDKFVEFVLSIDDTNLTKEEIQAKIKNKFDECVNEEIIKRKNDEPKNE